MRAVIWKKTIENASKMKYLKFSQVLIMEMFIQFVPKSE